MNDPYQVLGISRSASEEEIKKAYRAQCKRWHPDLNPGDATAEEHFKQVQEAYDAIMKGDTQQPQHSPYQSAYGQSQGYGQAQWADEDDPFGFNSFFGGFYGQGYGQSQRTTYQTADSAELQAARNFLANSRYAEARRVLDGITAGRTARWYYYSALANQGLGHRADALAHARQAYQMDPTNPEYRNLYSRMQGTGNTYRQQSQTYGGSYSMGRWCLSLILINLMCRFCGGGFYVGPGFCL